MMPNYAVYENNIIVNVIFAENKETAEAVTGMIAIETEGTPWINWILVNDQWIDPSTSPYPSWVLDENGEWQAPVPMPSDEFEYEWDENLLNWIKVEGGEENGN